MKLAVMQPYFFPYLGYFQLINAVNRFVLYSRFNFNKKSWMNCISMILKNSWLTVTNTSGILMKMNIRQGFCSCGDYYPSETCT